MEMQGSDAWIVLLPCWSGTNYRCYHAQQSSGITCPEIHK